ncbi:hypothetical protein BsWGS_12332 [Bradybaena similaris]
MVYKVTKGGVRSGNTLRCTQSVKAKRYSRQTCIVSRSNLYPEEIPKLLDSSEDTLLNSTLGSTDVILSLNKKGRWRIPAEISHMIKTGHFNKGKTVVSFLERHKLRRTANCIRFVSNQERLEQVVPKQKRYFSFNLNNIDRDESNRQLKLQKGTTKEQSQKVRLEADKTKDTSRMKYVTVSRLGKAEDVQKSLMSSKPEYRIEAFYPSPKSCSLTYNPKYTDVHMEFNPDGQMEIKSNVTPQKGTRRHRKRYSLKDLRLYEEELNGNGKHKLWYDEYDEDDSDALLKLKNFSIFDNKDDHGNLISLSENASNIAVDEDQTQLCDNTIAGFIAQAEKESNRKVNAHQLKKRSHNRSKEQASTSDCDDKSHIVYINKSDLDEVQDSPTSKYSALKAVKVILKSSENSPEKLRATFGCWYQEGNSEPRRFTINMTEHVNSLINPTNDFENEGTLTAHLVFVHAGHFDKDLDVFKVIFNSNFCKGCIIDSNRIPRKKISVHNIMNRIVRGLNEIKLKKRHSVHCTHPHKKNSTSVANLVHKCLMETTTDPLRYDFLGDFHVTENGENLSQHVNILRDLDYDIFCDNCYENIDAESMSWTRLLGCHHVFCDDCWRSYFLSRSKNGSAVLTCPGPGCDIIVDVVTLLSLLHVTEVSQLLEHALDDGQSSSREKLCPAPNCSRIVRHNLNQGSKFDVLCSCGHGFCFLCLSEPHWPCDCKQAQKYLEELPTLKPTDDHDLDPENVVLQVAKQLESSDCHMFEMTSRMCPKCFNLIEKDGDWSCMICKCGHEFCWNCLLAWKKHKYWKCVPCVPYVLKYTHKTSKRHPKNPKLFTLEGETASPNSDIWQQKATMYTKALEQRLEANKNLTEKQIQEIMGKITYTAERRLPGRKEILISCGALFSDNVDGKLCLLLPHVEKFLRSSFESKRAIHHMAEFTFVLLRDMSASEEKSRALRLLQDLISYCSFMKYLLDYIDPYPYLDIRNMIRQLSDIRKWSRQSTAALVSSIEKLKCNNECGPNHPPT